jgi:hypothetical protein
MEMKSITLHHHEVRGLLAGTLGQIRRVIEPQPDHWCLSHITGVWVNGEFHWPTYSKDIPERIFKPKYQPGDVVAVREPLTLCPGHAEYAYDLDGLSWVAESRELYEFLDTYPRANVPASRMPLWASRLSPVIAGVKVQRIGDASEGDVIAEGWNPGDGRGQLFDWHRSMWNDHNPRHPWATNPATWVFTIGKEK